MLEQEVVAAEDRGRNNDVGVHGPVWQLQLSGEDFAPAFGFATGVFVADQHRRLDFFQKFFEGVVRMTAEDEADPRSPHRSSTSRRPCCMKW